MKIFVLEVITGSIENMSIETVGVYENKKLALGALHILPMETHNMIYNIEVFEMNASPRDIVSDTDAEIRRLMDEGVIDQLVGEDGRFYYVLTEAGNNIAKKMKEDNPDDGNEPI